jgi:hypothetical protein
MGQKSTVLVCACLTISFSIEWGQVPNFSNSPPQAHSHASITFGDELFIFGGENEDILSNLWKFSFSNKRWTLVEVYPECANCGIPGPRKRAKMFVDNGVIYLFGGFSSELEIYGDLWSLLPHSTLQGIMTWKKVVTGPEVYVYNPGRYWVRDISTLFLVGGATQFGEPNNNVYSCSLIPLFNCSVIGLLHFQSFLSPPAVTYSAGSLFILSETENYEARLVEFDISSGQNRFIALDPVPRSRWFSVLYMHGSDIFSLFGYSPETGQALNSILKISLNENRTAAITTATNTNTEARSKYAASRETDGLVWILGGLGDNGYLNDLLVFNATALTLEQVTPNWLYPGALTYHSMVSYGNSFYLFGGLRSSGLADSTLWEFNINLNSWSALVPWGVPPSPRYLHSATVQRADMYVFGGQSSSSLFLNDLFIYDIINNSWSEIVGQAIPQRSGHCAFFSMLGFHVVGGKNARTTIGDAYIYNREFNSWTLSTVDFSLPEQIVGGQALTVCVCVIVFFSAFKRLSFSMNT